MNNNVSENFEERVKDAIKRNISKSPILANEKPLNIDFAVDNVATKIIKECKIMFMVIMRIAYESVQNNVSSVPIINKFLDKIKMGCFPVLETISTLNMQEPTQKLIQGIVNECKNPDEVNMFIHDAIKMKISESYAKFDVSDEYDIVMHQLKEIDEHESGGISIIKWNIPKEIKNIIKEQRPTDLVVLDESMLSKLGSYWIRDKDIIDEENFTIPADLLWSNTVPIKDIIIELNKEAHVSDNSHFRVVDTKSIRFIYYSKPEENNWKTQICIIAVVLMADNTEFVVPFKVTDDVPITDNRFGNTIYTMPMLGLLKTDQSWYKKYFNENTTLSLLKVIWEFATEYIPVWYGIQVGLLNPAIEVVFKDNTNPKHAIVETKKDRKGNSKTKIKYVRKLVISDDVFEKCLEHSYIRTKLCWYVSGHWRNQATKNGHKRIFIQGFWKGIARESKQSDTRDREIVLNEEVINNE